MKFRYIWHIFHGYMSPLTCTPVVVLICSSNSSFLHESNWVNAHYASIWLSIVLNARLQTPLPASAQVFMLAQIRGPVSERWTAIVMLSFLPTVPVTSLPDTSADIPLQNRGAVFTLFTVGSLQRRSHPPVNLLSTAGWAAHTFCIGLVTSGVFIFNWPWRCHWVTLKPPFKLQ